MTAPLQGAALLVERGMTVEARTLARSCLESAFYLGAVANDAEFIGQLISSSTAHKKKVANWLTSPTSAAVTKLSDEQHKKLGKFLADLKSLGAVTDSLIMEAAQKAGMGDIYEVLYRDLSNGAAHPSLDSLRRHIEEDASGNIVGLRFGPDAKDIRETIIAMTTALFFVLSALMNKFPNQDSEAEVAACWEMHKTLIEAHGL